MHPSNEWILYHKPTTHQTRGESYWRAHSYQGRACSMLLAQKFAYVEAGPYRTLTHFRRCCGAAGQTGLSPQPRNLVMAEFTNRGDIAEKSVAWLTCHGFTLFESGGAVCGGNPRLGVFACGLCQTRQNGPVQRRPRIDRITARGGVFLAVDDVLKWWLRLTRKHRDLFGVTRGFSYRADLRGDFSLQPCRGRGFCPGFL